MCSKIPLVKLEGKLSTGFTGFFINDIKDHVKKIDPRDVKDRITNLNPTDLKNKL